MESQGNHFEFCRSTLQKTHPDFYLLSLMAKQPEQQGALWVVFYCCHEILKIPAYVNEPMMGLIRLQWWHDEIEKIYTNQPFEPTPGLYALSEVIKDFDLPQDAFTDMIAACGLEVRDEKPTGEQGAFVYFDMLYGPLLRLIAAMDGESTETEPVSAIAMNMGVVDALRRGDDSILADSFVFGVQPAGRCAYAMQGWAELWFKHLRRAGFDPGHARYRRPPSCLAFRLWTKMFWK